jgi:hypothetical protein
MTEITLNLSNDLYLFLAFYSERNKVDIDEAIRRSMAILYIAESIKVTNKRLAIVSDGLVEDKDLEYITGY